MDNIEPLVTLGLVPADTEPDKALELAQAALVELRNQAAENVQAAANHASEIEKITASRDELASKVETLEASLAKIDDEAAEKAVEEAVQAGRIATQDEKSKSFWKSQIKADKGNLEILNSIPAKPVNGETVLAGKAEEAAKETELTGLAKVEAAFKAQKESH